MENEIEMPYGADLKTAFTMVETVGRERIIQRPELYKHLPASNNVTKSYSKKLAEFLGLVKSNGFNIEITEIGNLFLANKGDENRRKFLANNLPRKYKLILNWINNSSEGIATLNDLKQELIKSKLEDKGNHDIFDWMLTQFAKYGEYLGVIDYIKGQNSRCEMKEFGKQILSANYSNEIKETHTDSPKQAEKPKQLFYADINLEGDYPIRIMTNDSKSFDWDIHTEEDWKLVEQALKAIKARWEKNKNDKQ